MSNVPVLTDEQIKLAHDMATIHGTLARGYVLPPLPEPVEEPIEPVIAPIAHDSEQSGVASAPHNADVIE